MLRSTCLSSLIHLPAGRPRAAQSAVDAALTRSPRTPKSEAGRLLCRTARVFALTGRGHLDRARADAEELRAESIGRGERWARTYTDYQVAVIALLQDQAAAASTHARSMLRGKRSIGDRYGLALGLDLLAAALAAEGAVEQAAAAPAAAEILRSSVGQPERGTPDARHVQARYRTRGSRSAGPGTPRGTDGPVRRHRIGRGASRPPGAGERGQLTRADP
ncbi:hypothetical protein [Streptomyces chartreusis]|uniref:hypothetical protein n=1 Tax=Streptomyces chartreusis TaxID=1969 RepID=UPI0037B0F5A1